MFVEASCGSLTINLLCNPEEQTTVTGRVLFGLLILIDYITLCIMVGNTFTHKKLFKVYSLPQTEESKHWDIFIIH